MLYLISLVLEYFIQCLKDYDTYFVKLSGVLLYHGNSGPLVKSVLRILRIFSSCDSDLISGLGSF